MRILVIIIWLLATSVAAQDDRLSVVASASMISDIANNVIGDLHDVSMIVPIGGDPHLHEPTPRDARLVEKADLVLINGLTFEGWINELIDNSGTSAETVLVTEGVDVLTSSTYSNSADPHAWMDASNGIIYAENIYKAISGLDPDNEPIYKRNLQSYVSQLRSLDKEIESLINTIPQQKRVLITSHDAFQYFGRRYGIRLEAIMGVSTEAEAQTSDVRRVTRVIQESGIPAIFIESTINPKLINQLAQDNDVTIGGKLYADSLGGEDSPAGTYIDMLRYNTKTIVTALTKDKIEMTDAGKNSNLPLLVGGLIVFLSLTFFIFYKMLNK